jgi:hypothetical protein
VATVEDHPDGCFRYPVLEAAIIDSARREHEVKGEPAYWAAKYLGQGFYKMTAAASAFVVAARVLFVVRGQQAPMAEAELHFAIRDTIHDIRPFRLPSPLPAALRAEAEMLAGLLRDIIGNPVRPCRPPPAGVFAWNSGTLPRLAQAAYDDRLLPSGHLDPNRLAVLADALEEAGCQDSNILDHCRWPGEHVRGCWVVDLILGKS